LEDQLEAALRALDVAFGCQVGVIDEREGSPLVTEEGAAPGAANLGLVMTELRIELCA
jgi:hypothetical protein